jgi:hypothetical protein
MEALRTAQLGVRSDSLQGRAIRDDDYCILVVDVVHNFAQIAHVEPLAAARAFHEVIGLGFGDAVRIVAGILFHDRVLGFQSQPFAFARGLIDLHAVAPSQLPCYA